MNFQRTPFDPGSTQNTKKIVKINWDVEELMKDLSSLVEKAKESQKKRALTTESDSEESSDAESPSFSKKRNKLSEN